MNDYTYFYILGIVIGFLIGCYVSFIVYCRKLDKLYYETDGSKKGEQNELSSDRNESRDQAVD